MMQFNTLNYVRIYRVPYLEGELYKLFVYITLHYCLLKILISSPISPDLPPSLSDAAPLCGYVTNVKADGDTRILNCLLFFPKAGTNNAMSYHYLIVSSYGVTSRITSIVLFFKRRTYVVEYISLGQWLHIQNRTCQFGWPESSNSGLTPKSTLNSYFHLIVNFKLRRPYSSFSNSTWEPMKNTQIKIEQNGLSPLAK